MVNLYKEKTREKDKLRLSFTGLRNTEGAHFKNLIGRELEWRESGSGGEKVFSFVHFKIELLVSGGPQQAVRKACLKLKRDLSLR